MGLAGSRALASPCQFRYGGLPRADQIFVRDGLFGFVFRQQGLQIRRKDFLLQNNKLLLLLLRRHGSLLVC